MKPCHAVGIATLKKSQQDSVFSIRQPEGLLQAQIVGAEAELPLRKEIPKRG
jgi:hypothetical protein